MTGITLKYYDEDYRFVLDRIEAIMQPIMVIIVFRMYQNEEITNRTYSVVVKNRLDLDWGNFSYYYRLLCEDLKLDPSIVPDGMEG